jgi:hypothetical protein
MFGQTRLNELRARKELLLVQADAQRRLMALDARKVEDALQWVGPLQRGWQRAKPLAWLAAPVGGFFLARHGRSVWRYGRRVFKAWRWISGLGWGSL